jgi:hypothetical protein
MSSRQELQSSEAKGFGQGQGQGEGTSEGQGEGGAETLGDEDFMTFHGNL